MNVHITVYIDATAVSIDGRPIGCHFNNEAAAISAAIERLLVSSHIIPTWRKLPELTIRCDYQKTKCTQVPVKYISGIIARIDHGARKVVRTPGAGLKPWLTGGAL